MKIALAILHADPARGGAERYTVDLAGALAQRHHEVELIAASIAGPIAGVESIKLPVSGITRLGKYLRYLDRLDEHLANNHYDIVHAMLPVRRCHFYHPHAGMAVDAVKAGHRKYRGLLKRLFSRFFNRVNIKRNWFARIERDLLNGPWPPVVLCLSDYVKTTVVRHYPNLTGDHLATLFNAVDLQRFDPAARPDAREEIRRRLKIPADGVMALMIAQDYRRKGLREAIRGFERAAQQKLYLVVVGKQNPGHFRRMAQAVPGGERIIFAGSTRDPYAFYSAADFFVLPTFHDPCSLVVLEALAMGLPVVSTRRNGACEIMESGVHGYVLDRPSDISGLARAFGTLMDPDRRAQMSQACSALRSRLAFDHHVEEVLRIYQSVFKPQA